MCEREESKKKKEADAIKTFFEKKSGRLDHRRASFSLIFLPLPPVTMARGRSFFSLAIALLTLCAAVAAVTGAEVIPAAPVEAVASSLASVVAPSNASGETKKAEAAPISPPSGVQVTVFRASGWPAGTLTIPATVANDVSDLL